MKVLSMSTTESSHNPPSPTEPEQWLARAQAGEISWSELAERLLSLEYASDAAHRPDVDRRRRCGFGEVIFGSGKSAADISTIAQRLLESGQREVLATRVESPIAHEVAPEFPASYYDPIAKTLRLSRDAIPSADSTEADTTESLTSEADATGPSKGEALPCPAPQQMESQVEFRPGVIILTAGSTDLPVAREALQTLRWMGVSAELICDVGVAGPYRLLPHLRRLRTCTCVVVVAGMEGALASVVGGLVAAPIIAVPTSVGYGANLQGITTLLSMISSCAAGVTVVNIDAGFKGGYVAGLIANQCHNQKPQALLQ